MFLALRRPRTTADSPHTLRFPHYISSLLLLFTHPPLLLPCRMSASSPRLTQVELSWAVTASRSVHLPPCRVWRRAQSFITVLLTPPPFCGASTFVCDEFVLPKEEYLLYFCTDLNDLKALIPALYIWNVYITYILFQNFKNKNSFFFPASRIGQSTIQTNFYFSK